MSGHIAPVVYLSGPMSGQTDNNYPAFNHAARVLRERGFVVTNPAENFGGLLCENAGRAHYMRQDIGHVLAADLIVVLDGWLESRGARTEVQVAFELGTDIYEFRTGFRIVPLDLTVGGELTYGRIIQTDSTDTLEGRCPPCIRVGGQP